METGYLCLKVRLCFGAKDIYPMNVVVIKIGGDRKCVIWLIWFKLPLLILVQVSFVYPFSSFLGTEIWYLVKLMTSAIYSIEFIFVINCHNTIVKFNCDFINTYWWFWAYGGGRCSATPPYHKHCTARSWRVSDDTSSLHPPVSRVSFKEYLKNRIFNWFQQRNVG